MIYANGYGEGKGTHVSPFVQVAKGKYDAKLKWPFVGDVDITLLNQLEDENHYQEKFVTDDLLIGRCSGLPTFIPYAALRNRLQNTQYLKNDTLYFRVSVQAADHKPWLECGKTPH